MKHDIQVRMPDEKKPARWKRIVPTALMLLMMFTVTAFASSTTAQDVATNINTGMGNVYKTIQAITLSIGAVSLAGCGMSYFFGGEKGMEAGKKWAGRIVIGVAIICLGPVLITTVANWFGGLNENSFKGVFN